MFISPDSADTPSETRISLGNSMCHFILPFHTINHFSLALEKRYWSRFLLPPVPPGRRHAGPGEGDDGHVFTVPPSAWYKPKPLDFCMLQTPSLPSCPLRSQELEAMRNPDFFSSFFFFFQSSQSCLWLIGNFKNTVLANSKFPRKCAPTSSCN